MSEIRRMKRARAQQHPAPAMKLPSRSDLWICGALILGILAVYSPTRRYEFVGLDDPIYVRDNANIADGFTWHSVQWAFTSGHAANWHPVTWLSHILDIELFGLNPGPHHLVNVVLHTASTLVLFLFLRWVTEERGASAFVAGVFALHPLHVESVAWIAERKDVLSAFFWIATMCCYVWYVRQPSTLRYALTTAVFVLGLMSKPMLVTLPFVLLLLDYWPLRRTANTPASKLVNEKLPLLGLAVASSIATFFVQKAGGAVQSLETFSFSLRVANALVSYVAYAIKMIWPAPLAVLYPYPLQIPVWKSVGAAVVILACLFLAIREKRQRPFIIVGLMWYLITLLPVIGLVQVGEQSMADRYSYIPLIGLSMAVIWTVQELTKRNPGLLRFVPFAAAAVLVVCAWTARAQVMHWSDSVTLWNHTLEVTTDNYAAHNNLGYDLAQARRTEEAISQYREAIRIKPDYKTGHANLGAALAVQGKLGEAIAEYNEAIRLGLRNPSVHAALGLALAKSGRNTEAISEYSKALQIDADHVEALEGLGNARLRQGSLDEAVQTYEHVLRVKPDLVETHNNLGAALAMQGRPAAAIQHFREVLRLNPNYPDAKQNLARAEAAAQVGGK